MGLSIQKQQLITLNITDEDIPTFVTVLTIVKDLIGGPGFKQGLKKDAAALAEALLEEISNPTQIQEEYHD